MNTLQSLTLYAYILLLFILYYRVQEVREILEGTKQLN